MPVPQPSICGDYSIRECRVNCNIVSFGRPDGTWWRRALTNRKREIYSSYPTPGGADGRDEMSTMKLKISGMTCDHCVRAVTKALTSVDGVERVVEVNLERGEALIEGSPKPQELFAAVEEEGYTAEVA